MSAARPAPVRRTQPTTGGWIALIVFLFLAGLGAIAALGTVGVYSALASGLPDPKTLETYALPEETVVYDRTGKVELARFGDFKREIVQFQDIPKVLIDATTAVEDKTFWQNAGFDPVAILSAGISSLRGDSRGASTITQQLVRARLLPDDLVSDPHRTAERKLKEIIQSIRLTEAYEGESGKQKIMEAYLNQNYYGNQTYGVKAAVRDVLRRPARQDRSRAGGDHRGPTEVPFELRPRAQRERGVQDSRWPRARTARPRTRRSSSNRTAPWSSGGTPSSTS
jgi:membrane peptidoglycan carboxypeptidase